MRSKWIMTLALSLAAAMIIGCSGKKEAKTDTSTPGSDVVARVGDWVVTSEQLDTAIQQLPEQQQAKYKTLDGRAELTNRLIEEEMYNQEGLKEGLDEDPAILKAVEDYKRGLVVTEYFHRNVEPLAYPTEEEMYDFYEQHKENYTKLPIVRAQHIFSKNRDKLVDFKKRIEEGEKMTALAMKYSEDVQTRDDGGDLGYFNPDGYIRGVGYSKEISDAAFTMTPGVVSDPIKWEKGYSLLRVNEYRPAELRPYEEVKDDIRRVFTSKRIEVVQHDVFEKLSEKYHPENLVAETLKTTQRSDVELWNLAQESQDPYQRLRAYEDITKRYPDSKYAPDALFMIGFVYAEELKDVVEADRAFTRVVNEYPDSKVAKSAEWMLQNLNKPLPEFEDLDDLNKKIEDSK